MRISTEVKEDSFKPISFTIVIESLVELEAFRAKFNVSTENICFGIESSPRYDDIKDSVKSMEMPLFNMVDDIFAKMKDTK